ncbi:MAG: tetratricopeptide repeat protein [candidate division Zixibacteria bacterium]|nr:tetratricopeptide repeat protein [candidate division Zixibacteria bacterium]
MTKEVAGDFSDGSPASSPLSVLAASLDKRFVIQDYRPLAESLDWELGQLFWQEAGSEVFLGGNVPFKITNDGNLSKKAAEVFFAGLAAAEADGKLEPGTIYALEIGVGAGLFARFFLDRLRSLCRREGRDYYDRFCYVAADRSEQMLADLQRNGILSPHRGHYRTEEADALRSGFGLNLERGNSNQNGRPFRAIFFNYLLDCLPPAVLKFEGSGVSLLYVQTMLARGVDLQAHTTLSASELARRGESLDGAGKTKLLPLYPLFVLNYEYRPATPDDIPYGPFVVQQASANGGCLLHNYGAIRCLEEAWSLLQDGGFVLINDYDDPLFDEVLQGYRHQKFGGSTAVGVNIPLLKSYFESKKEGLWVEPPGENRRLCSRLLGRELASATAEQFKEKFSQGAFDALYGPIETARNLVKEGRLEAALPAFYEALSRQPENWALMDEAAGFLTFKLRDYNSGLEMAKAALELNPISPDLWNTYGDCLFYLERADEAHAAFLQALKLNPADVRARYNLIFTFSQKHNPKSALRAIGEGLALDKNGEYRERLLQKQSEILNDLRKRQEEKSRCLAGRFGAASREKLPDSG